jgi:hypothetical protein
VLCSLLQHLGREAAERLQAQHQALAAALANLGQQSPAAASFDLALVEVLEAVDEHVKVRLAFGGLNIVLFFRFVLSGYAASFCR